MAVSHSTFEQLEIFVEGMCSTTCLWCVCVCECVHREYPGSPRPCKTKFIPHGIRRAAAELPGPQFFAQDGSLAGSSGSPTGHNLCHVGRTTSHRVLVAAHLGEYLLEGTLFGGWCEWPNDQSPIFSGATVWGRGRVKYTKGGR